MIGLGIAVVVIVIIGIAAAGAYNTFVRLRANTDEAFSTMDVYLKRRFDMIPNLVEIVKGYAAHESNTLEKVIQARSGISNAQNMNERLANENALSQTLKSLFAVAEGYPDLKANVNFLDLQQKLTEVEEDILNARKYYNGNVKILNVKVEMFPSNIFAAIFGFKKYPFYLADEAERENVQVQF